MRYIDRLFPLFTILLLVMMMVMMMMMRTRIMMLLLVVVMFMGGMMRMRMRMRRMQRMISLPMPVQCWCICSRTPIPSQQCLAPLPKKSHVFLCKRVSDHEVPLSHCMHCGINIFSLTLHDITAV